MAHPTVTILQYKSPSITLTSIVTVHSSQACSDDCPVTDIYRNDCLCTMSQVKIVFPIYFWKQFTDCTKLLRLQENIPKDGLKVAANK